MTLENGVKNKEYSVIFIAHVFAVLDRVEELSYSERDSAFVALKPEQQHP